MGTTIYSTSNNMKENIRSKKELEEEFKQLKTVTCGIIRTVYTNTNNILKDKMFDESANVTKNMLETYKQYNLILMLQIKIIF